MRKTSNIFAFATGDITGMAPYLETTILNWYQLLYTGRYAAKDWI